MEARSQPSELVLVPYVHEVHKSAFLAFLARVLGDEVCRKRGLILDTIHERMPLRDRVPLRYIVLDGECVAGTLGHLPADFLVRGRRVPVRFTCDLLVDPRYAAAGLRLGRKTLGMLLLENAREQGGFIPGGLWMTPPSHQLHLAVGFDDTVGLPTYTLALAPRAIVGRRELPRAKSLVATAALVVLRQWALAQARAESRRGDVTLEEVDRIDPALDSTWLDLAGSYSVTRIRDASYLNWRYADHPILDYRILLARHAGDCVGYIVWRTALEHDPDQRAIVVDFLVRRGGVRTFRALVARVVLESAGAGMETLSILATQSWASALLRQSGFMRRKVRNKWVVAGWHDHIPPEWLHDLEAWHLCIGDSDGDLWTGTM